MGMGFRGRTARRGLVLLLVLMVVSGATAGANSDARRWMHGKARHWFFHIFYRPDNPQDLGDGGGATDILLHSPMGLAEDAAGNVYVTDRSRFFGGYLYRGQVVWRIDRDGRARVIAGTGYKGDARAGIPALESDLGTPDGIAVARDGRILFSDSNNNVVLRIETNGTLSRFAGTGKRGYSGDDGPAADAMLNQPYDLRLDGQENLYIADFGNNRIRKVAPDGTITTVAGTGVAGYAGDGGPATAAQLRGPYGILVTGDGRLLIADSLNNAVRMVDRAGIITTIAGTGEQGYSGDGGLATAARLNYPESLAIDAGGRIYVGDEHNYLVRVIDADGTISRFLGTGSETECSDGAMRNECGLNPQNMVLRADGSMLVTDRASRRVMQVASDGTVTTFAGRVTAGADSN